MYWKIVGSSAAASRSPSRWPSASSSTDTSRPVRGASGRSSAGVTADARRLGGEPSELAESSQPRERLTLELPDALTRQVELVPDRLERPRLAFEPEAQLEDAPLALRQGVERLADVLAAERLLGLVERIRRLAVGKQVAELPFVVCTDRL